jgi:hypothetical protein
MGGAILADNPILYAYRNFSEALTDITLCIALPRTSATNALRVAPSVPIYNHERILFASPLLRHHLATFPKSHLATKQITVARNTNSRQLSSIPPSPKTANSSPLLTVALSTSCVITATKPDTTPITKPEQYALRVKK